MSTQLGKLKKIFRFGSQSTSQSRSSSPPSFVAPSDVSAPSPAVAVTPLVSLPPPVDAPAPVHPPPATIVPLTDPASPVSDLESTAELAFSVNPAPTATMTVEEAARLRAKYTHFRILVIGRANAGKTTLLKRVCNTKDDPVYDCINPTEKRGIHNVRDEFIFEKNPGFIFHDSPGFEAGGKKELEDVLSFIQEKAKSNEVKDQIHAIWFCFEPDVSRPLLELESTFFNNQRAGNVPVVAIFTKFDVLITRIYDRNKNEEENLETAHLTLEEKFKKPLRGYKYPPHAYVHFESIDEDEGNHQEQVGELIKQTTSSIDDLALKMLFITIQQNNLEVCIECAVNVGVFRNTSIDWLVYDVVTWFGHCYDMNKDYGNKKEDGGRTWNEGGLDLGEWGDTWRNLFDFSRHSIPLVKLHYDKPSLPAFAAILICVENSFWHAQKGSTPGDGFQLAWDLYSTTKMDEQIKSQWPNDWFSIKSPPSQAEQTKFINFILVNCLSHSEPTV